MANLEHPLVVHLLPHIGGGVGTVVKKLLEHSLKKSKFTHQLISLESLSKEAKAWCAEQGVAYIECALSSEDVFYQGISTADILHIHWWNHPLLMALLFRHNLPHARTILWSHVNGAYAPQVFSDPILAIPDRFVVATPFSLGLPSIQKQSNTFKEIYLRLIQSNAGPLTDISRTHINQRPRVGYIGTVDYSKMHPEFIDIWLSVNTDLPPLMVCGGPSDDALRDEVSQRGCKHRFDIKGHVDNVPELLSELDILFYPLSETHYGTGEQVLIEAMSAGVVPVVLSNNCEAFIVTHNETGFVAQTVAELSSYVDRLSIDTTLRARMSDNAKTLAAARFSINHTVMQWHILYDEVRALPKRRWGGELPVLDGVIQDSTAHLLLSSYGCTEEANSLRDALEGDCSGLFHLPKACYSQTRGSAHHYAKLLPNDGTLHHLCDALNQVTQNKIATRACPNCYEKKSECIVPLKYALFDDLEFEGSSSLVNCLACGFLYNELDFTEYDLSQYYKKNDHYLEALTGGSGGTSDRDAIRYQLIWDNIQSALKKPKPSVLDVGCGKGGFLSWLHAQGITKLSGVEPGAACHHYLHTHHPEIDIFQSLDKVKTQTFDVIVLSHVLEHIISPRELLHQLKGVMHESTLLYIEVPDAEFYLKPDPLWSELYFEHINHFTEHSLNELCRVEGIGCETVQKKSFYEHTEDSPVCLYTLCTIKETTAKASQPYHTQYLALNSLDAYINHKLIDEVSKPIAFWGISQYVQLLLGSSAVLMANTVGLFDSSSAKIGRVIHAKKIQHYEAIADLGTDILLLLPDKAYASDMEKYLKEIDFKGDIRRF